MRPARVLMSERRAAPPRPGAMWPPPRPTTFGIQRLSLTQLAARRLLALAAKDDAQHAAGGGSRCHRAGSSPRGGALQDFARSPSPGFPGAGANAPGLRLAGLTGSALAGLRLAGPDLASCSIASSMRRRRRLSRPGGLFRTRRRREGARRAGSGCSGGSLRGTLLEILVVLACKLITQPSASSWRPSRRARPRSGQAPPATEDTIQHERDRATVEASEEQARSMTSRPDAILFKHRSDAAAAGSWMVPLELFSARARG